MKILIDTCVFIDAFDIDSDNHRDSLKLLEKLRKCNLIITMPAHAWFEVKCTFQKLKSEKRFKAPTICGTMDYSIELIHIDDKFINKYAVVDIPYIKAGDHIFMTVAKLNNYPLITSDGKMISSCKKCGINVYTPSEFLKELSRKSA